MKKVFRNSFYYDNFREEEYFTIEYFKILCASCYFSINASCNDRLIVPSINPLRYEEHDFTHFQVPSSQVPSSQVPSSQVPSSQVPSSQVPSSQVPSSQVPSSQVPSSQVPSSQVPSSQVPSSQVPYKKFEYKMLNSNRAVIRYSRLNILVETEAPYKVICLVSDELNYYLPIKDRLTHNFFNKYFGADYNNIKYKIIRDCYTYKGESEYVVNTSELHTYINTLNLLPYEKYIEEIQEILERRFNLTRARYISIHVDNEKVKIRVNIFKRLYDSISNVPETLKSKRSKGKYKAKDKNLILELRAMSDDCNLASFL